MEAPDVMDVPMTISSRLQATERFVQEAQKESLQQQPEEVKPLPKAGQSTTPPEVRATLLASKYSTLLTPGLTCLRK